MSDQGQWGIRRFGLSNLFGTELAAMMDEELSEDAKPEVTSVSVDQLAEYLHSRFSARFQDWDVAGTWIVDYYTDEARRLLEFMKKEGA